MEVNGYTELLSGYTLDNEPKTSDRFAMCTIRWLTVGRAYSEGSWLGSMSMVAAAAALNANGNANAPAAAALAEDAAALGFERATSTLASSASRNRRFSTRRLEYNSVSYKWRSADVPVNVLLASTIRRNISAEPPGYES